MVNVIVRYWEIMPEIQDKIPEMLSIKMNENKIQIKNEIINDVFIKIEHEKDKINDKNKN